MRKKFLIYRHVHYTHSNTDELEPLAHASIYGKAQPSSLEQYTPADVSLGSQFDLFLRSYQPRDIKEGYKLVDPEGVEYTVRGVAELFIRGQYVYQVSAITQDSPAVIEAIPELVDHTGAFLVDHNGNSLLVSL